MNIRISPKAREHLVSKGVDALRLDSANHRSGGCSMALAHAVIKLAAPKDTTMYHQNEVDGITVYTSFILSPKEGEDVEIDLQKVLGIRSLVVSGFNELA